MKKGVRNTVIGLVAFMALLVGMSVQRILSPAVLTHEQLNELGFFAYEVPRRFSDFTLTNQYGDTVHREDLEGRWSLVFFGYTFCPDICPLTLATLSQFTDELADTPYGEDTQVIMVTVDPERDSAERLKDYMGYFNDDYLGLTGEYIEIFNFARQLNIAFTYDPQEEGDYLVSHSGEVALINPNGHFHGFFKNNPRADRMLTTYSSVRESF